MLPRIALVLVLLSTTAAFAAAAPPTAAEVRAEIDAGRHPQALSMISRALASRGAEADGLDRYELLWLRGEAYLRMRSAANAEQAFEDAFNATTDVPKRAAAGAEAALVRRSAGLAYTPKGKPATGRIDIVDPASRKLAMAALADDLRTELAPRVAQASKARTIPPLRAVLPDLMELVCMEAVLGGERRSGKDYFAELSETARKLITNELRLKRRYLEEANGVVYGAEISSTGNIRPRVLNTEDKKQLNEMAEYVGQIGRSAQRGRRIAQALGEGAAAWEAVVADAADLAERIDTILTRGQ